MCLVATPDPAKTHVRFVRRIGERAEAGTKAMEAGEQIVPAVPGGEGLDTAECREGRWANMDGWPLRVRYGAGGRVER